MSTRRLDSVPPVKRLILTAGGLGLLRPAPGTWGSLPPVVLALGMVSLIGPNWTVDAAMALVAVVASVACIRFASLAEDASGKKDPSAVVIDEVAGQAVALVAVPWRLPIDADAWIWNLAWAATAFLGFRALDILKPPPAHQIQRLRGGLGILMDDLIAGLYTLAFIQVVARVVLPMMG